MTKNKQPITSIIQKVSNLCGMVIAVAVFVTTVITTTAPTVFAASTYEYTTPGTFELTLPEGTKSITVTSVGGGGGKATVDSVFLIACGGGGEVVRDVTIPINSNKNIEIIVGNKGSDIEEYYTEQTLDAGNGGASYVIYNGQTYATAKGGGGGSCYGGYTGEGGKAGGTGATDGEFTGDRTVIPTPGSSYSDTIGIGAAKYAPAGDGAVFISCEIDIATTGITLNQSSISLTPGDSSTLTATVSPSNATDKTVTWTTSSASVATVSGGKVTAVGAGTATITATTSGGQKATCTVTVRVPVTGITVSRSSLSLNVGATSTLTATVSPSNATNKSYSWSSNNTGVATVNSSGLVTAKANGTATITATTGDGAKTASCTVVVTTPTSGITVSPTTATIIKGNTQQLTATVAPPTASDKSVTWSSSNAAIASVSTSGLVTAKAAGTATITATSSGGHKAECKVTVRVPVTGVTLSSTSLSLIKGNSRQLTATVAPSDASTKTVTWTSTNKSVATVSSAGIVAAVGGGDATITATTSDGSFTASCAVTVTVPVEGVKFNDVSTNVGMGSTTKLNYTITPSDATNKTVTWQSSDTAVATVDKSSGIITPVAPGGTEITVTTEDGGYSDTTLLIVTNSLKTIKLKVVTESGKFPPFATAYYKSSGNVTEYPGIPVTSEGEMDVTVPVTHSNYKLGISHINSLITGMEIASTTTDATSSPLNMIEGDFNADNIITGTDWTIIVQRKNYGGGETQYGLTGDMNYDGIVDDLDLLLFNAPISFTGASRFLTSGFDMAASAKAADTAELAENSYDYQFAVGTAFDLYAEETPDEATVADDSVISDTPPLQSIIRLTELKTIGRERRYEVTLSEPSGAINMFQLALDGSVSEITYALPEGFEIIGSGEKDGVTVIAIGTQHEGGLSIPADTPFITIKAAAMPGILYGEDFTTMQRATESGIETLSLETGSNGATVATDSSSGGGCNAGAAASALLAFAPFIIHKLHHNRKRRNHK